MRKKVFVQMRTFVCPECGNKIVASKHGHYTGNDHKKNMYCHSCKHDVQFTQISSEIVRVV